MRIDFDWDPAKAATNATKHQVTFEEAMTIFGDPLSVSVLDDESCPARSDGSRSVKRSAEIFCWSYTLGPRWTQIILRSVSFRRDSLRETSRASIARA